MSVSLKGMERQRKTLYRKTNKLTKENWHKEIEEEEKIRIERLKGPSRKELALIFRDIKRTAGSKGKRRVVQKSSGSL